MMNDIEKLPDIIRDYLMLEAHEEKPTLPIYISAWPPDEIEECIMVTSKGQSSRAAYLGQDNGVSTPLIACMVRANTYDVGMTNMSIIRQLLNQKVTIGDISIVPSTNIVPFGRDEKRRHVFQIIHKTIAKE